METSQPGAGHDTPRKTPVSAAPEANLSGRRLGDYQLLRRLGRGGMADVYLAEQGSLRRQVAFKVLHANLACDDTYVRRFHNEAQAAAALVHANIVQIYEVGCIDGIHFIAQEYVSGQNLRQVLTRRGPLDARQAVSIIGQVAAALHKAASRGITHRDIKPENIMLASTGEVKVADFGLARVTGGQKLDLTQVGVTMGTPLYMSPEQVEGRPVDHRSDLYSLGVSSYQMLAGRAPFEADTALAVAVKHLKDTPQPLAGLRPDVPAPLCQLIHKMLAKQPSDRYQSAVQLLEELQALSDGKGPASLTGEAAWTASDVPPLADTTSAATQLQTLMHTEAIQAQRRRPLWPLAALLLLAFLLGGAAAWLMRPASLLAISGDELPQIERMPSAQEQFNYALELASERALQSVLDYFPPGESTQNELYGYKAKLHLAYLYDETDRVDEALALYQELALQELDQPLQAIGLIGQANIFAARGARMQATQKLNRLVQMTDQAGPLAPSVRQDWLQRLNPGLRGDFERMLRDRQESDLPAAGDRNRADDGS